MKGTDPRFDPITRDYFSWKPEQGPPSWYADGSGTAGTYDDFLKQQEIYVASLQKGGLHAAVSGGTPTYTVVTNRYAISPGGTTYSEPLGPFKDVAPEKPRKTEVEVAAAAAAINCPPGFAPVRQSNGKWTCFQATKVSGTGLSSAPGPLQSFVPGRSSNPMATQTFNPMVNSLTGDQIGQLGGLAGSACDLITNPTARAICRGTVTLGTGLLGGGGGGGSTAGRGNSLSVTGTGLASCPDGYRPRADGNGCEPAGVISRTVGQIIPGDFGQPDRVFQAVGGGMGGVAPAAVPATRLVCPRRYVLGLDNVCYPKPMIPRNLRKWKPESRPLLSAMDAKVLNRAKSVAKRVRKAAGKYAPAKKACSCARGKKKQ